MKGCRSSSQVKLFSFTRVSVHFILFPWQCKHLFWKNQEYFFLHRKRIHFNLARYLFTWRTQSDSMWNYVWSYEKQRYTTRFYFLWQLTHFRRLHEFFHLERIKVLYLFFIFFYHAHFFQEFRVGYPGKAKNILDTRLNGHAHNVFFLAKDSFYFLFLSKKNSEKKYILCRHAYNLPVRSSRPGVLSPTNPSSQILRWFVPLENASIKNTRVAHFFIFYQLETCVWVNVSRERETKVTDLNIFFWSVLTSRFVSL